MHVPSSSTTRIRSQIRQEKSRRGCKEGKDLAGRFPRSRGGSLSINGEPQLTSQRHKLKPPLTPVTPESFAIWKKTRLEKKAAEQEAMEKAKTAQRAAGKLTGLSGRALFEVGGDLYGDDEDDGEEDWDISRMLATYVSCLAFVIPGNS
jgi:hypothetical protein